MADSDRDLRISVVIPAYNAAAYVGRAIESVLAQRRPASEIIVVDDDSQDDTRKVVAGYAPTVRYLWQKNGGSNAARNTGIQAAAGPWVAFLDADDEWLPGRLALQVELLKAHPQLRWATGNYYRQVTGTHLTYYAALPERIRELQGGRGYFESWFEAFAAGLWGHTDAMLFEKAVLEEAGLFRPGVLWADDLDMWFRVAFRHPQVGYVSEPIARHYLDTGNIARRRKRVEDLCEVIQHNMDLAGTYDQSEAFEPCARLMVRRLIRSMFFEENRKRDIRYMLEEFGTMVSRRYWAWIYALTLFPEATRRVCLLISKLLGKQRGKKLLVNDPSSP